MGMKTITNEVIGKISEFKKLLVSLMCDESTLMGMDEKTLKAIQLSIGMIDDASKLMEEYVEVLDEQNRKLDMILEKLDKENRA